MSDRDSLQRFAFEAFPVRGLIVRLDASWQAVLERHDYPALLRPTLGQALAAVALMAATIKFRGRITLQAQGDGPVNLLVAQSTDDLQLRGLARWKETVATEHFARQTGSGRLTISIHSEANAQPYQGVVPLKGTSLAQSLESYFDISEQVPTRFWFASNAASVTGLLLQRMPDEKCSEDQWQRVQLLADTLRPEEQLGWSNDELLRKLFYEDDLRVFDHRIVSFRCSCSLSRIETMLQSLGHDELKDILAEQGHVAVSCEFCNRHRRFDAVDVSRILEGTPSPGGPKSLH
ncbi:MAG: Hsp33 family molecular chaperone HslO [Gammaproteobacteria bacterium]|nr:Hsp33 family molecular chaperone HslO [Gammaproteobacteria bacterium]